MAQRTHMMHWQLGISRYPNRVGRQACHTPKVMRVNPHTLMAQEERDNHGND